MMPRVLPSHRRPCRRNVPPPPPPSPGGATDYSVSDRRLPRAGGCQRRRRLPVQYLAAILATQPPTGVGADRTEHVKTLRRQRLAREFSVSSYLPANQMPRRRRDVLTSSTVAFQATCDLTFLPLRCDPDVARIFVIGGGGAKMRWVQRTAKSK
jgi:hypothetical protein